MLYISSSAGLNVLNIIFVYIPHRCVLFFVHNIESKNKEQKCEMLEVTFTIGSLYKNNRVSNRWKVEVWFEEKACWLMFIGLNLLETQLNIAKLN